jgi:hypothetical protein
MVHLHVAVGDAQAVAVVQRHQQLLQQRAGFGLRQAVHLQPS